jgi:hypothetical protein
LGGTNCSGVLGEPLLCCRQERALPLAKPSE